MLYETLKFKVITVSIVIITIPSCDLLVLKHYQQRSATQKSMYGEV